MRLRFSAAAGLFAASLAAHANTLVTYQVFGGGVDRVPDYAIPQQYDDYLFSATGTAIYDQTTDNMISFQATGFHFAISALNFQRTFGNAAVETFEDTSGCSYVSGDACMTLTLTPDGMGYFGGSQNGGVPGEFEDFSGGLQLIAQTPEPSSFALLGTGLFCVVGIIRKRLV